MKHVAFNTGKDHQAAVATWARKRLADRRGRKFIDGSDAEPAEQRGCLFADGVGLGKTWEALAAVALLLDKRDWRKRRSRRRRATGRRRVNHRRREARILILVPPGLVAKWSGELHNPEAHGFPARLKKWAKKSSREFIANTLAPESCYVIRRRDDLDNLPRGSKKRGSYQLPAGTYICNWNVFTKSGGRGLDRVNALKNQRWEAVVVDEAHHRQARASLANFKHSAQTLLLTATPFQLDMTELHGLTKHLLVAPAPQHKVLKRGAVREYATAADSAFAGGVSARAPTMTQRRAAEFVLGQLVACSQVGRQRRHYFAIDATGEANPVTAPTDLEAKDLPDVFARAIDASGVFDEHYLRKRLDLARREAGQPQKHIAIELQKLLSVRPSPAPSSPRLDALRKWARGQFEEDLKLALADGLPRKLLVFTHLKTHVAQPIKLALEAELKEAHARIALTPAWRKLRAAAARRLETVLAQVRPHAKGDKVLTLLKRFELATRGTLYYDLFGSKAFAAKAKKELIALVTDASATGGSAKDSTSTAGVNTWLAAQSKALGRTARALLSAVAAAPLAATFTGDDSRIERDANAEAFKSILAPWILVATNVGSEGIDLQTYSRHLVHFDLEWNPARMEQREGRIDRLGRALTEPARIYYLLVKDTYDERMFHQFIARQRWHGVLLGRKALQLGRDDSRDARLLTRKDRDTMALNLDPGQRVARRRAR